MQDEITANGTDEQAERDFAQFKRMKRNEEARANVAKIECDCLADFTEKQTLRETCRLANSMEMGAVVVFPAFVKVCTTYLGRDPKCALIAAISYPYGLEHTAIKVAAVKRAVKDGADEVEVSVPTRYITDGNIAYFKRECKKLKKAARSIALRLVMECSVLSEKDLIKACLTAADAGVHCVRLNGAHGETVAKVKQALRGKCLVKADGVESFSAFVNFCVMGADYVSSVNACELAANILRQAQE